MTFIIADVGSNICEKGGVPSFDRAKTQIQTASLAGVDAVKFQLYTAETLFVETHEGYAPTKRVEMPPEWIPELASLCKEWGVEFMCTPFHLDAVDLIDPYVKRHKIASWDITYLPLIRKIASKKKPIIMSTGAATDQEVAKAVNMIAQTADLTLLHCTGGYPTPINEVRIEFMDMLKTWVKKVGFSCHCTDEIAPIVAVARGATAIEVHYDHDGKGEEQGHSYTYDQMVSLVSRIDDVKAMLTMHPLFTSDDFDSRNNKRRNTSNWLRPENQ